MADNLTTLYQAMDGIIRTAKSGAVSYQEKVKNLPVAALKTRYETYDEDIPYYRGGIHLLTCPVFFLFGYPLVGINYLISFFYHRVPIQEEITKFLDHLFVALRILSFPETVPSKFWYRYRLLTIPIVYYLLFYKIKELWKTENSWQPHPQIKLTLQDIEYYRIIQKLMILFSP